MAFTQIIVTRRYLTAELTPAAGRVVFTPQVPMVNGSTVIAAPRAGTLDADGDLQLAVAANNDPTTTPVGVSYLVREEITGQRAREYYVVIPFNAAGGTVDLSTLNTAQVPPAVAYPAPGPQGPQGIQGPPGSNATIGGATDLNAASPVSGQVITVTTTAPLAFDLADPPVSSVNGEVGAVSLSAADVGAQPLDADLTAIAGLVPTDNDVLQRKSGAWTNRTPAQLKADLALTAADVGLGSVANAAQVQLGTIDAKGDLLVGTADNTVARVAVAANGQTLVADSAEATGVKWSANPNPAPVTLTDGATVALNAANGRVFKLTAAGDRTILAPTNPSDGRGIIIRHTASGAARTLTLTTGSAGSFKFGSDITALSATASGATDYIGCIYDSTAARWHVVSYVKGY